MPRQLSPFMIPISHADLELTGDGPAVQAVAPIAFGFTYAGIAFEAKAGSVSDAPRLAIRGRVGTMPYSVEGMQRRIDVKSIVEASRDAPSCLFSIDARQEIWLDAEIGVEAPVTPTSLIASTAAAIARAKPWLDMLRFYVAAPPGTASFTVERQAGWWTEAREADPDR
jgi:hypothetical protein